MPQSIDGVRILNAREPVILTISGRDVKNGATKAPETCAAALACKRELAATDARIHIGRCYLKIDGVWKRYMTSKALRTEIIAFDRGGEFRPGQYVLNVVPKYDKAKVTKRTKPKGAKDNRVKISRKLYHRVSGIRQRASE